MRVSTHLTIGRGLQAFPMENAILLYASTSLFCFPLWARANIIRNP